MPSPRNGLIAALCALLLVASIGAAPAPSARVPAHPATFRVVLQDPMHRITTPRTDLSTLRGQVVVLAFLDDACATCEQTAQLFQVLGSGSGTAGLAVATGVSPARALAFATKKEGPGRRAIPTAVDPNGAVARAFGVSGLPTLIVLDRRGRIVERLSAPPTPDALRALLAPYLAEPIPGHLVPVRTRPHLSVFDRPAGAIGPLPSFLRQPGQTSCHYVPGSVRLIGRTAEGARFFIARALDGGLLIATAGPGGVGGLGCGTGTGARSLARMRARGIVTALGEDSPQGAKYFLVVLDGYTQVRAGGVTFPVADNGAVVTGVGRQTYVTLSGPAGTRHVRIFG